MRLWGDDAEHRLMTLSHEGHGKKAFVLVEQVLKAPAPPKVTDLGIQLLQAFKGGTVAPGGTRPVNISALVPTQRGVFRHKVVKAGEQLNTDGVANMKPIVVMKYRQKLYILDGHHHTVAAALAGLAQVHAYVLTRAGRLT